LLSTQCNYENGGILEALENITAEETNKRAKFVSFLNTERQMMKGRRRRKKQVCMYYFFHSSQSF
jgi:hypothetical protein